MKNLFTLLSLILTLSPAAAMANGPFPGDAIHCSGGGLELQIQIGEFLESDRIFNHFNEAVVTVNGQSHQTVAGVKPISTRAVAGYSLTLAVGQGLLTMRNIEFSVIQGEPVGVTAVLNDGEKLTQLSCSL